MGNPIFSKLGIRVIYELEVCKKIRFDFRSDIGLRRMSNIRHSTVRPIESKKSDPTNKANRIEYATFDSTECTCLFPLLCMFYYYGVYI